MSPSDVANAPSLPEERVTVQRRLPNGETEEVEMTLEQFREQIDSLVFTGQVAVSKSEKRQVRQYESNDYFMSMTLNLDGVGALLAGLNGTPVEVRNRLKQEVGLLVLTRMNRSFDVMNRVIRERQALDGIRGNES